MLNTPTETAPARRKEEYQPDFSFEGPDGTTHFYSYRQWQSYHSRLAQELAFRMRYRADVKLVPGDTVG